MNRSRAVLAVSAFAIAMLTVWVHWPSVHNEFLHWDDYVYVDGVKRFGGVTLESITWASTAKEALFGYYHPLTWLSHILDLQLFGMEPAGHHLSSVILHGLNAALVVLLVWMLLRPVSWLSVGQRWAITASVGVVFGIHPLQVESVAWLAERKNVLCAFFSLASLCAYLQVVAHPKSWGWRIAMTGLFVAALLSKPMAVSLPVIMLAIDFYPLRRHLTVSWFKLLGEKVVLIVLVVAMAVGSMLTQAASGALADLGWINVPERCLLAVRGIVFYLWKLLWPAWLSPHYPLQEKPALLEFESIASLVVFVAVTAGILWRMNRRPAELSAWVSYLALVIPVSGLVTLGTHAAADRYMYLAILPLLVSVAAGCVWMWQHLRVAGRIAATVLLVFYALFLGFRTRGQILVWENDETVWRAAIAAYPNSGVAHYQLGTALARQGEFEEARTHAVRAIEIAPHFPRGHAFLGYVDLKLGRLEAAETELSRALQLDPDLALAFYYQACVFSRLGRITEAYALLERAVRADGKLADGVPTEADLRDLREHPDFADRVDKLVVPATN